MNDRTVQIMGIINVTPDSFSGDGVMTVSDVVQQAKQMLADGADLLDIGGESTRPGSEFISLDEELSRVIPVITQLKKHLGNDVPLSIDTYKAEVAQQALHAGATMVNSLGGFLFDPKLIGVIKEFACPLIIYHIKGEPKTMQVGEIHYDDVIGDIATFFEEQIALGAAKGLEREQFLLDPGIGFGKTVAQNLEIIKRLSEFTSLELPLVIGVSRKSHLGKILQETFHTPEPPSPSSRVEASLAETAIAIQNGATMVRTHDVLATKRFLAVLERLL